MNSRDLEMLDAWRHGRLPEDQFAALQERLRSDPELRAALRALAEVEEGLSSLATTRATTPMPMRPEQARASSFGVAWLRWRITAMTRVAAVVAIVAVLLRPAALPRNEITPQTSNKKLPSEDSFAGDGFCRLAQASAVRWDGTALQIGDRLSAGRVKLADGIAVFSFDNGVRMVLAGPAEIELRDAMHAWLHSGQVVCRVPPTAIGFTVETNEAAIVDLGTEFGLCAGDAGGAGGALSGNLSRVAGTELQVYEGEVVAEVKSERTRAGNGKQRIHGGQALQINPGLERGAQRLPFWPERFVHELPDPRDHPDAAHEHSGRKTSRYNKAQHDSIHIPPAPKGIVIDGSLADWDLSGRFSSACEPPFGEFYNLQGAMMFDDDYLYIGAVVADPFPMRSTVSPSVDRELYGGGGCMALRLSMDRKLGWPVRARGEYSPKQREMLPQDRNDRLVFVVLWYFAAEQLPCLHLKYGMDFHGRVVNPSGYRGAWKKRADGLGYTVEYAIPWSLLHAADDPPRSGDTLAASWLVHWSDSNGRDWRGHLIDIVNPAEKGWDFQNAATWGRAVYGRSGNGK